MNDALLSVRALAHIGYNVTIMYANDQYTVRLVHKSGKNRKAFRDADIEAAIHAAMVYAKQFSDHVMGES